MERKLSLAAYFMLYAVMYCHAQGQLDTSIARQATQFWDTTKFMFDISNCPAGYKTFTYKNKRIVFFGTRHDVKDIDNPMMVQIEQQINLLNPGKIFIESYGAIENSKEDAANHGDANYCRFLGYKKNIPVACWDNDWNSNYYSLLKQYPEDELLPMMLSTYLSILSFSDSTGLTVYYPELLQFLNGQGWPVKPADNNIASFYAGFKKYAGVPYRDNIMHENLPESHPAFDRFLSALQKLRERQMLLSLQTALQTTDNIFVQAGAAHLKSLQNIIPLLLQQSVERKQPEKKESGIKTFGLQPVKKNPAFVIIKKANNQQVSLFTTSHAITNAADKQFATAEKIIASLHPDLILTEGYGLMAATKNETIALSGDAGFCRYIGIEKQIRINSWEPSWNEVYYELAKKYTPEDIRFSLQGWALLRDSSYYTHYGAWDDYFDRVINQFNMLGFPVKTADDLVKDIPAYLKDPAILQSLYDTYRTPIADSGNKPGAEFIVEPNGKYTFAARPGNPYKYKIPLCPPGVTSTGGCPITEITQTTFDKDSTIMVNTIGTLEAPGLHVTLQGMQPILARCINLGIINDMHLIRANHLLQVIKEYQHNYSNIFVQADAEYIEAVATALNKK